jgi:hypothetical protein
MSDFFQFLHHAPIAAIFFTKYPQFLIPWIKKQAGFEPACFYKMN